VLIQKWKKYVKETGKLMFPESEETKMEIVSSKKQVTQTKKKRVKGETKSKIAGQSPVGVYMYYGYPMYQVPKSSMYWPVIQTQCYYPH